MSERSGAASRRIKVREVTGVFRSREDLEAGVDALLRAGFDRADIDLMADIETVAEKLRGLYAPPVELADRRDELGVSLPRRPAVYRVGHGSRHRPRRRGLSRHGSRSPQKRPAPENWPLEREPYYLETNVPGVFAAGDVRHGSVKRCASAVGEGAMAVTFVHRYLTSG